MEYMIFQLYLQLVHFLCYIFLFTFAVNTSAISFAIFAEFTGSFVVTVIFIISVSFTALTVTLFF